MSAVRFKKEHPPSIQIPKGNQAPANLMGGGWRTPRVREMTLHGLSSDVGKFNGLYVWDGAEIHGNKAVYSHAAGAYMLFSTSRKRWCLYGPDEKALYTSSATNSPSPHLADWAAGLRVTAQVDKPALSRMSEDATALFEKYDQNNDGFLDKPEIDNVLLDLGAKTPRSQGKWSRKLLAYDKDGNSAIDFAEFTKWFRSVPQNTAEKLKKRLERFKRKTLNSVTPSEYKRGTQVEVFSVGARRWVQGTVVKSPKVNSYDVKFPNGSKTTHLAKNIRPVSKTELYAHLTLEQELRRTRKSLKKMQDKLFEAEEDLHSAKTKIKRGGSSSVMQKLEKEKNRAENEIAHTRRELGDVKATLHQTESALTFTKQTLDNTQQELRNSKDALFDVKEQQQRMQNEHSRMQEQHDIAISQLKSFEDAEHPDETNIDNLTHLPNTSIFKERVQIANRSPLNKLLMVCDVANFSKVNQLTHRMGDLVLKNISNLIQDEVKPYNAEVFRIGGDKFACLILAHDIDAVRHLPERLATLCICVDARKFEVPNRSSVFATKPVQEVRLRVGAQISSRSLHSTFVISVEKLIRVVQKHWDHIGMDTHVIYGPGRLIYQVPEPLRSYIRTGFLIYEGPVGAAYKIQPVTCASCSHDHYDIVDNRIVDYLNDMAQQL